MCWRCQPHRYVQKIGQTSKVVESPRMMHKGPKLLFLLNLRVFLLLSPLLEREAPTESSTTPATLHPSSAFAAGNGALVSGQQSNCQDNHSDGGRTEINPFRSRRREPTGRRSKIVEMGSAVYIRCVREHVLCRQWFLARWVPKQPFTSGGLSGKLRIWLRDYTAIAPLLRTRLCMSSCRGSILAATTICRKSCYFMMRTWWTAPGS
ncbi:hypothetical protein VFPBJ_03925 [Purpureocillium lilacinum]|uniref:Uncharacterized protein n=1 Tax=Purpureocillium lilacinum TaxID=33203 RepID=A0A179GVQ5_PURLI|nr:hypothetical protein VFPBJ_03925 [Purpureocillium lilacinum]